MYTTSDGLRPVSEFAQPEAEFTPPVYEYTPVGVTEPSAPRRRSRRRLAQWAAATAVLAFFWLGSRPDVPASSGSQPALPPVPTAGPVLPAPTAAPAAVPTPTAVPTPAAQSVSVTLHLGTLTEDFTAEKTESLGEFPVEGFLLTADELPYLPGNDYDPVGFGEQYHCHGYAARMADGSWKNIVLPMDAQALIGLPVKDGRYVLDLHPAWSTPGEMPEGFALPLRLDDGHGSVQEFNASTPLASMATAYLPVCVEPVQPGLRFTGWYLDAACTDGPIYAISALDFFPRKEDGFDWSHPHFITLYAGWEPAA